MTRMYNALGRMFNDFRRGMRDEDIEEKNRLREEAQALSSEALQAYLASFQQSDFPILRKIILLSGKPERVKIYEQELESR